MGRNGAAKESLDSRTVNRVLAGELCAGCGLCAGISDGAISMEMDASGFSRPVVGAGVSQQLEKAIAHACPGNVVAEWPSAENSASDVKQHPFWGPYIASSTGHALDEDVRFNGSSGGFLSSLAIYALEAGLVDGVLHIHADGRFPLRNRITVSRKRSDVLAAAGSRYGPSPLLEEIETILSQEDGRFMVIGKPCDISALRRLAQVDPRVDKVLLYMLSFFCGGMPSINGTYGILAAMGVEANQVENFRYRGEGWPGTAKAVLANGESATMSYADSWGAYLSSEVQYRCKICPDAVGGSADIACADAWYGGESGYPQFTEQDGRSLILGRTTRGQELVKLALAAKICEIKPLSLDQIELMQPSQARRKRLVASRSLAARILWQPQPRMRGVQLGASSRRAGLVEQLKSFLGSVRRIIMDKR